jgi:putative phosphoribosyl transferase
MNSESVIIESRGVMLLGELSISEAAHGVILFAHGSGSGRLSPRNGWVASKFNEAGFATLLIDLLTEPEATRDTLTMEYRFDVKLLAKRMLLATEWLSDSQELPIGYYGASTGASAALIAAAERPKLVAAVVSRGGRVDLAGESLPLVKAPTLLIVGSLDVEVLELNKEAQRLMKAETRLEVVKGATHLFKEPGKLDKVAKLSIEWFKKYLS